MTAIPKVFYAQKTPSGDNFGRIFARLFLDIFEINESTVNQFRNEEPGNHIQFEHLSEKDRYSTSLTGHTTAGFKTTHLSHNICQFTDVKKNCSIIKKDLLPYLRYQVVLKDLMPSLFKSLEDIQYKKYLTYYIFASLPTTKELLVRYLIAFEKNEIGLDEEIIGFVDFFYLFTVNLGKLNKDLSKNIFYFEDTPYADHVTAAKKVIRKSNSILVRMRLVNKKTYIEKDLCLLVECLRRVSIQAQIEYSPKSIYQALPQLKVLFDNI